MTTNRLIQLHLNAALVLTQRLAILSIETRARTPQQDEQLKNLTDQYIQCTTELFFLNTTNDHT